MKERTEGSLAFALLFFIIFFFTKNQMFVTLAASIIFLALLNRQLDLFIDRIFHALIRLISKINSVLILSLIFFIILTPLSLLYRISRSSKKSNSINSYFEEESFKFTITDFQNLW